MKEFFVLLVLKEELKIYSSSVISNNSSGLQFNKRHKVSIVSKRIDFVSLFIILLTF